VRKRLSFEISIRLLRIPGSKIKHDNMIFYRGVPVQQVITMMLTTDELIDVIRGTVTEVLQKELNKNDPKDKDGPLISIAQAALLLNVSKVTIWTLRKKGLIRARKIGRRVLFDKNELLNATNPSK
jgi:excisionase family DNA binding protein